MRRDLYDDALTLREARETYFVANAFGLDGGYSLDWVDVKVGPIPLRIPNTAGRKRAVRFHDLHHTLTGYRTTSAANAEIGAWEVATGCADHWAAWFLNLSTIGSGLLFAAGDVWRAFVRGRRSGNLYRATFDDALLDRRLGDVRRRAPPGGTSARRPRRRWRRIRGLVACRPGAAAHPGRRQPAGRANHRPAIRLATARPARPQS